LAAIGALLASPLSAAVKVPDWVHEARAERVGPYGPETKAVVVRDDTTVTVLSAGEHATHYRRVVKILRPDGREEGVLSVYLRGRDRLLSIHAWTIDAAGHEYELKDKDFLERSPFSFVLYEDVKIHTATAPAAESGSIIAFEYEVREHPWFDESHWFFQESIPVREASLTVNLPSGWEDKASWSGNISAQPISSGPNSWQWTLRDIPAIENEPMMPPYRSLLGRMELAYYGGPAANSNAGSWDALGRWYVGLTAGRRTGSPELSEKERQLTAGKPDFYGKLQALASFLQSEIRYVAIEIGIGGYQPHAAADIFRLRYGDCKDKATLLSSMLQEAGIRSHYVLIETDRGVVKPEIPSPLFNHAILAIELPDDGSKGRYRSVVTAKSGRRYLIFDPTDEYTPLGELRGGLQDSYALLVSEPGGELIRTPLLPPDANLLTRTGHFALTDEGTLEGEVVEDRSGDHAAELRALLHHWDQKQRDENLERRLNRSFEGFTLQSTDIRQLDEIEKDLVVEFKFTTPQYAQLRGPLMLVRPRVVGEKSFYVEDKPRRYPIELGRASLETDTFEIEIPHDYKVDDLPSPVNVDVGFASYRSKIEVDGSKLRYRREYVVRGLTVSPDSMADWRRLQGVIGADEAAAVVLKRTP
jgi:hypothetical protein